MSRRAQIVSVGLGAVVATAIGLTTGQWRGGAFVGGGVGALLGFLEHLHDEREELVR